MSLFLMRKAGLEPVSIPQKYFKMEENSVNKSGVPKGVPRVKAKVYRELIRDIKSEILSKYFTLFCWQKVNIDRWHFLLFRMQSVNSEGKIFLFFFSGINIWFETRGNYMTKEYP